jgi:hypothetical protein
MDEARIFLNGTGYEPWRNEVGDSSANRSVKTRVWVCQHREDAGHAFAELTTMIPMIPMTTTCVWGLTIDTWAFLISLFYLVLAMPGLFYKNEFLIKAGLLSLALVLSFMAASFVQIKTVYRSGDLDERLFWFPFTLLVAPFGFWLVQRGGSLFWKSPLMRLVSAIGLLAAALVAGSATMGHSTMEYGFVPWGRPGALVCDAQYAPRAQKVLQLKEQQADR